MNNILILCFFEIFQVLGKAWAEKGLGISWKKVLDVNMSYSRQKKIADRSIRFEPSHQYLGLLTELCTAHNENFLFSDKGNFFGDMHQVPTILHQPVLR